MKFRNSAIVAVVCGSAVALAACGPTQQAGKSLPRDAGYGPALTAATDHSDLAGGMTTQRFCDPVTDTITIVATPDYGGSETPAVTSEPRASCLLYPRTGKSLPRDPGYGPALTAATDHSNLGDGLTTQRFCEPDTRTVTIVAAPDYGRSETPAVTPESNAPCSASVGKKPAYRDPAYGAPMRQSSDHSNLNLTTTHFCTPESSSVLVLATPDYGSSETPAVSLSKAPCRAAGLG